MLGQKIPIEVDLPSGRQFSLDMHGGVWPKKSFGSNPLVICVRWFPGAGRLLSFGGQLCFRNDKYLMTFLA